MTVFNTGLQRSHHTASSSSSGAETDGTGVRSDPDSPLVFSFARSLRSHGALSETETQEDVMDQREQERRQRHEHDVTLNLKMPAGFRVFLLVTWNLSLGIGLGFALGCLYYAK